MSALSLPRLLLAVACTLALAACDSGPGSATPEGVPPVVSDLTFSPQEIGSAPGGEGAFTVPLTLDVAARDEDGDLDGVFFAIQSPASGQEPVATGSLESAGGGRFAVTADVSIPEGEIGVYTIVVYAVDAEGSMSNTVLGNLKYVGTGEPPVIEDVEAEPEIVRPPTQLRLIAIVSDPDGLANIARVIGTTPSGFEFDMADDGRNLGDEEANDGRYTATFDVPSATPGTQTFTFVAIDKSGLRSEVFTKEIEVE